MGVGRAGLWFWDKLPVSYAIVAGLECIGLWTVSVANMSALAISYRQALVTMRKKVALIVVNSCALRKENLQEYFKLKAIANTCKLVYK